MKKSYCVHFYKVVYLLLLNLFLLCIILTLAFNKSYILFWAVIAFAVVFVAINILLLFYRVKIDEIGIHIFFFRKISRSIKWNEILAIRKVYNNRTQSISISYKQDETEILLLEKRKRIEEALLKFCPESSIKTSFEIQVWNQSLFYRNLTVYEPVKTDNEIINFIFHFEENYEKEMISLQKQKISLKIESIIANPNELLLCIYYFNDLEGLFIIELQGDNSILNLKEVFIERKDNYLTLFRYLGSKFKYLQLCIPNEMMNSTLNEAITKFEESKNSSNLNIKIVK